MTSIKPEPVVCDGTFDCSKLQVNDSREVTYDTALLCVESFLYMSISNRVILSQVTYYSVWRTPLDGEEVEGQNVEMSRRRN